MNIPPPALLKKAIALKVELEELDRELQSLLATPSLREDHSEILRRSSLATQQKDSTSQEEVQEEVQKKVSSLVEHQEEHQDSNPSLSMESENMDHPASLKVSDQQLGLMDEDSQEQLDLLAPQEKRLEENLVCSLDSSFHNIHHGDPHSHEDSYVG